MCTAVLLAHRRRVDCFRFKDNLVYTLNPTQASKGYKEDLLRMTLNFRSSCLHLLSTRTRVAITTTKGSCGAADGPGALCRPGRHSTR